MRLLIVLICVGLTMAERPYIIGGNDVTVAGKWPHQGEIQIHYENITGHFCGISLISPTWGVTSARFMEDATLDGLRVMFGSNDRTKGGQVINLKQYILHEEYNKGSGLYSNDIAVVEFTEPVRAEHAAPIPLTDGSIDPAGNDDCWITGWGFKEWEADDFPEILQEAKMNVYTNEDCKKDLGSFIDDGQVCVGDTTHGRASCFGDSGGALVCKVNGRYELFGAESWGLVNCLTSFPSVYTRVGYFREWIRGKTGV